jgi:3-carboxy-cis,cis-muconate cycloisomerase
MPAELKASLFSTPEMDEVFCLSRQLRYMTRFEWVLASALECNGIAETGAANAIEPFLDAQFANLSPLLSDAQRAGNIAIPFVRQLTAAVSAHDERAARHIHFGATSQDVLDTALVLQLRDADALIRSGLDELASSLAQLARKHANTILAGRTWLQDGPPITLGLKVAGWLAAVRRHKERLATAEERALTLQFGGAVGTLASLGEKGPAVSRALAEKLDLKEPELPWHTHRDNLVELTACLGLLVGTLGKIARDVALLMQTEIGEAAEPGGEGRGGSSTMPHKRNPVASAIILSAAARVPALVSTMLSAMVQEQERALGGWQAEWETIPQIYRLTASALARTIEIARGLEVNPERMIANLSATGGLVMSEAVSAALSTSLGRTRAHALLEQASRRAVEERKHLRDVLLEVPEIREHLDEAQLDRLLDPHNYLGSTQHFIRRVLGAGDASR